MHPGNVETAGRRGGDNFIYVPKQCYQWRMINSSPDQVAVYLIGNNKKIVFQANLTEFLAILPDPSNDAGAAQQH